MRRVGATPGMVAKAGVVPGAWLATFSSRGSYDF
jgi:hypothetical protein